MGLGMVQVRLNVAVMLKKRPDFEWERMERLASLGRGRRVSLLAVALCVSGCGQHLHGAVARGDVDGMRALIAADPDSVHATDKLGKTPLHFAVTFKQLDTMAVLLEADAEIEARDVTGMTPLHVAAMLGRRDAAAWLVDRGADAGAVDDFGDTPIHTAALFGQGGIIADLSRRGASLTQPNAAGKTPIDLARAQRRDRVVAYLQKLLNRSS